MTEIDKLVSSYWAIDEASPSGLVFIRRRRGSKSDVGDPACNCVNKRGYYVGMLGGRLLLAHRVVFYLKYGYWSVEVDHIDGNPLNNATDNLRAVSSAENSHNTVGRGYYYHKQSGKYVAYIKLNGKRIGLGSHTSEETARQAYLEGKRKYHPTAPGRCYA